MRRKRQRTAMAAMDEINVTPLLDLTFLLLIAFMLTMTVYAKLKDLPVDEEAIPAPFRGLPIALLTAGMMVLAMMALQFNVG